VFRDIEEVPKHVECKEDQRVLDRRLSIQVWVNESAMVDIVMIGNIASGDVCDTFQSSRDQSHDGLNHCNNNP
jgi:hypothetical protein